MGMQLCKIWVLEVKKEKPIQFKAFKNDSSLQICKEVKKNKEVIGTYFKILKQLR